MCWHVGIDVIKTRINIKELDNMTKVKNEMNQTKRVYTCPALEVVDIEMEQALLSASQTEDLGVVKEEIGWSSNRRRGSWGDLWEEQRS